MNIRDVASEAGGILYKSAPGAAGTAGTALTGDVMLSVLVGLATLLFVLLQIAYLIWKWRRNSKTSGALP